MTNHPLRATAAILCAALALAGCSSEKDPASGGQMVKAAASAVLSGRKAGEALPGLRSGLDLLCSLPPFAAWPSDDP